MLRWAFRHQVGVSPSYTHPGFRSISLDHGIAWCSLQYRIFRSRDAYITGRRLGSEKNLSQQDVVWPGDTVVVSRHSAVRKRCPTTPFVVQMQPPELPPLRFPEPPPPLTQLPPPSAAEPKPPRRSARIAAKKNCKVNSNGFGAAG